MTINLTITNAARYSPMLLASLAAACTQSDSLFTLGPDLCASSGIACVWAGTSVAGFDGPLAHRLDSRLYHPLDLTFAPDGRAYIVDFNNHQIRRVEPDDSLTTAIGGGGYEGDGAPAMEDRLPACNPAGAPGAAVALNHPTDVEISPDGLVYVAASHNHKIRVLDPETNVVISLAGGEYGYSGDNGPACSARFNTPHSLAFASCGTLYTIDQGNVRIRAIQQDATRTITTIAGFGASGNLGDGGPALEAQFGFDHRGMPTGSLVIHQRRMYVADGLNNRIRRIDLETGQIDAIAGQVAAGYAGDGGQALDATLNSPNDLEIGPDGRLYIADGGNHAIRAIDLTTGIIETVVGTGSPCDVANELCPGRLPAGEMQLNEPHGIAFDAAGNLYITDTRNHRILRVAGE